MLYNKKKCDIISQINPYRLNPSDKKYQTSKGGEKLG